MTSLAELERRVREGRRFDAVEASHLHRATREDDWSFLRGREAVRDAAMADVALDGPGPLRILHDLGDMIAFETHRGWAGHRWVSREGGRVLNVTAVDDGMGRARGRGLEIAAEARRRGAALPTHAPLGELRAGRGQLATTRQAVLPSGFPDAARPFADAMHLIWNARALGSIGPRAWTGPDGASGDAASYADWLAGLLAELPDLVLLFERGVAAHGKVALLWRIHGHDAHGRRIRAIGSNVLTLAGGAVVAEDLLIDTLAVAASPFRPRFDYGD